MIPPDFNRKYPDASQYVTSTPQDFTEYFNYGIENYIKYLEEQRKYDPWTP